MRIALFILFVLTALFAPLFAVVSFGFVYAFTYTGYELIIVGACIDALFGITPLETNYTFTLLMTIVVLGTELIRPFVLVSNTEYDVPI